MLGIRDMGEREAQVEEQHCTRCGGPVDLDRGGPNAGYWVRAHGSYHPWGEWCCIHFRCRVPGVDDEI